MQNLVDAGADIHAVDRNRQGRTPLHVAAGRGYLSIVEYLVEMIDILTVRNLPNNNGVVYQRNSSGFSPTDANGETPYNIALRNGFVILSQEFSKSEIIYVSKINVRCQEICECVFKQKEVKKSIKINSK